jgi:hypothetical protein
MRKTVLALSLVAAFALQTSTASAATGSLSFTSKYSSAYTQWSEWSAQPGVATTHSESASRTGAVRAEASATGNRPVGWSAISVGTVSQSASVDKNAFGYRIEVTFTGVTGGSTGTSPEGDIGTAAAQDTVAALGLDARLSGQCTSSAPCDVKRTVVTQQRDRVTIAVDFPPVAARSTMIVQASAQAWLRTPTDDGLADSAKVSATVASLKIVPRTS